MRSSRLRGWLALALAAVLVLLIGLEGRRLYGRLPDQMPARYSLAESHEAPGATHQKTPWSVFAVLAIAAFALVAGAIAASEKTPGVSRSSRARLAQVLSLPGPQREYAAAPWGESTRWACAIAAACLAFMQRAMWYGALGGSSAYPYIWFISMVILGTLVVARGETLMIRRAEELRPPSPSDAEASTAGS